MRRSELVQPDGVRAESTKKRAKLTDPYLA